MTQSCIAGRDALRKQAAVGLAQRLLMFTFDDPSAFPWGGEPILMDGTAVGELTRPGTAASSTAQSRWAMHGGSA